LAIDIEKIKRDLYLLINQQQQVLECSHLFLLFSTKKTRLTPEKSKQQCFILLQNFLLLFTSLDIASCPMGGFQELEIITYCEKNNYIPQCCYNLAVIFTAGYPQNEKE
jgi:nitroreductase